MASCLPNQMTLPLSASSQHVATQAAAAAQAAVQAAALEQLRDKPRENKMMMVAEEQQRLVQHVLQQNLLAMATQLPLKIKLNNRGKVLKVLLKKELKKKTTFCTMMCLSPHTDWHSLNQVSKKWQ